MDWASTTDPVAFAAVSTAKDPGEPGTTVNVPEFALKPPTVAAILALPMTCPLTPALLLSPAGEKSPPTTPPVTLPKDHDAATFATKPPKPSRWIAKTVMLVADGTFVAPTGDPLPLDAVSNVNDEITVSVAAPVVTLPAGLLTSTLN